MNDMDLMEFAQFLVIAKEKEKEERLYMKYCAILPNLKKEYWDFEKFKELCTGANIDMRPAAEIIAEINAAHGKEMNLNGNGNF